MALPGHIGKLYEAASAKRGDLVEAIQRASMSYAEKYGVGPSCVVIPKGSLGDEKLIEWIEANGFTLLNRYGWQQYGYNVWVGGPEGEIPNIGEWTDVESSHIKRVKWNDDRGGTMTITFLDSSVYNYYEVPRDTYDKFLEAESKGKYFDSAIKNKFLYEVDTIPPKRFTKIPERVDMETVVVELEPEDNPLSALITTLNVIREEGYEAVGVITALETVRDMFIVSGLLPGASIVASPDEIENPLEFRVQIERETL